MLEKSLGLLFFLKRPQNYTAGHPMYVYLRITVDGEPKELSLKRSWDPERWNPESGRASGTKEDARQLNAYLDTMHTLAQECRRSLLDRNITITAIEIKKMLTGNREDRKMILLVFKAHNDRLEKLVGEEYALRTLQRFETTLTHTRNFIQWKFQKNDLDIRELNFEFISDYAYWLKSEQKCNHNTTMKYLAMFKKVILHCVKAKWLPADPFSEFKLTSKKVIKQPLTQQELNKIAAKKFDADRLNQVRDVFVFSCYTGLAYADIHNLCRDNIQPGTDGQQWIFINRQKTETLSRIPLLPIAMRLIGEYQNHPKCSDAGKLFPLPSNQKMNAYLKEIADICGLKKKLTCHIARYTFATTITLSNGVPIETVADMLGHTTLRQTQHYTKLLDHKIGNDMANLRVKLAASPTKEPEVKRVTDDEKQSIVVKRTVKYTYVVKST